MGKKKKHGGNLWLCALERAHVGGMGGEYMCSYTQQDTTSFNDFICDY